MSTLIKLPDFLADAPFAEITLNRHHPTVESYKPFDEKTQSKFNRSNFGFLVAAAYPNAGPTHFRAACDLMNLFFVFDDTTDDKTGAAARELGDVMIDALSNPSKSRPPGESFLGEMARRALECSSPSSARRFLKNFAAYVDAAVGEAEDRDHKRVRSIEDYLDLRRPGIATRPCFEFLLLPDDLPDEVIYHPAIERLVLRDTDMIIMVNDVYSYNKEQAAEENMHNIVTSIMKETGIDVQGVMDCVGEKYRELAKTFMDDLTKVPSFGNLDNLVSNYTQGIANWNMANFEYSIRTERYFGAKIPQAKSNLILELVAREFND